MQNARFLLRRSLTSHELASAKIHHFFEYAIYCENYQYSVGSYSRCLFVSLHSIKQILNMEQKTIKALFVNGGPRKNKNTAQMLENAMKVL